MASKRIDAVAALMALALAPSSHAQAPHADDSYSALVIRSDATRQRYPMVTSVQPGITDEQAFRIQGEIVRAKLARGDRISGYKGGLMSAASQRLRDANGPIFGVLMRSGRREPGRPLPLGDFRKMVIECEIGFTFKRRIDRPVTDFAALRRAVGSVHPAIEVPDVGYVDRAYSARDMIASNITARDYIEGGSVRLANAPDLNLVEPVLYRDGVRVASGKATDALGDQWKALQAVVNLAIAHGHVIRPGQTIITGALAVDPQVQPGAYRADFGSLGDIRFTVAK